MKLTRSARIGVRFAVGADHGDRHDDSPRVRTHARIRLWLGVCVAVTVAGGASGALAVSGSGTIATIAGIGSSPSQGAFSGDGGPATKAQLSGPHKVAVDIQGNVYIADYLNDRVRKVTPAGRITTFAGGSGPGDLVDGGPATGPRLLCNRLRRDRAGNVYIGWEFGLVWRVGRDGKVTTVAGRHPDDPTCGGPPFPRVPRTAARQPPLC